MGKKASAAKILQTNLILVILVISVVVLVLVGLAGIARTTSAHITWPVTPRTTASVSTLALISIFFAVIDLIVSMVRWTLASAASIETSSLPRKVYRTLDLTNLKR